MHQPTEIDTNVEAQNKPPMFLLVLQDKDNGEVDVAGTQRPREFLPDSPAHLIGKWIEDNLSNIAFEVSLQRSRQQRLTETAQDPAPKLVLPGDVSDKLGG
jgi:hypothetical protein